MCLGKIKLQVKETEAEPKRWMINGEEDTFVFKYYPRLDQMNACPGTGNTRAFIRISTNILQSADTLAPPCLFEVAVQDLFSFKT